MKNLLLIFIVLGILNSCKKDDGFNSNTELIGNWKLIEILADPGDGSGIFQSVKSNKTLEFKNDGTIITNGSLCDPYSNQIINSGTYNWTNNTIITNCQNPNISTINFELKNQNLILNYISNEGYSQKFIKVD